MVWACNEARGIESSKVVMKINLEGKIRKRKIRKNKVGYD